MTPQAFVQKWKASQLKERSASQEHFIDLCRLIGQPTPAESDPDGSWYTFERGARKTGGGEGWADVWKKGCFAWEYKGKHKDLTAAFAQLQRYAIALENPPLLVVSDMETIVIHSNFTNTVQEIHTIALEDIGAQENLQKLRWLFSDAEQFRPSRTTFAVTEEAAQRMGEVAKRLTGRGEAPQTVAHFLIQCVFCMFAEDAGLLPQKLFETVLDKSNPDGTKAQSRLAALFQAMQGGGDFALENIPWFNGGLFKEIAVPRLETADVVALLDAARMNWSAIEPAILGTLFERGLNPDMRSQLGAHYTDPATILKLIHPVIEAPLLAEWQAAHHKIAAAMEKYQQGGKGSQAAHKEAHAAFIGYLEHLKAYRVLDPACGSGNFLYLALKTLKDLEHRANLEAEALGLQRQIGIETGPANVLGIELNPYAAELARVTVWIGELQWMLGHGYPVLRDPILRPLDHIEQRDAVLEWSAVSDQLSASAREPEWPEVDAIVGNPPFLGGSKKRGELGDAYFEALNRVYKNRVPGGADLVTYWFEKARAQIEQGKAKAAGLVATNSIRGGANRKVLERIVSSGAIFEAWSDEEWINQGAAVRVSLVCFGAKSPSTPGGGVGEGENIEPGRNIASPKPPLSEKTKEFARALRKSATDAENLLWQLLRKNQLLGYGFRRQHPIGRYFLDFYCHQAKLAIELDGGQHAEPEQQTHDEKRSAYLADQGISVLRFWNNEVLENTEGVLQSVFDWLSEFSPTPTPPPKVEGLSAMLDGQSVAAIHADLTGGSLIHIGSGMNLTLAKPLKENAEVCFAGTKKYGDFDIPGELARQWLKLPNPHGKSNSEVVKPWRNGQDITGRPSDTWIIDFGVNTSEEVAALYEAPFAYVIEHVKNTRKDSKWWLHERPRPELRKALHAKINSYIVTPQTSKHRLFAWLPVAILPDQALNVIAHSDDTVFGILHSRLHELWSLRLGTSLEDRPRYTPSFTFETFPFPAGFAPSFPALLPTEEGIQSPSTLGGGVGVGENIARAARNLDQLRNNWLNPPEWADWVRTPEEEKAGFPLRPTPKPGHEAELKKRTLTNLYNARPAWLANAHRELDQAVAAAYGWADYTPEMPDEEILRRLLALNLERSDK